MYSHFSANNITLESFPFSRELSMEAYLIENESVLALGDSNYSQVQVIDTELSIPGGGKKSSGDGRLDLLALYDDDIFGLIELKKESVCLDDIKQLRRYLENRGEIFSDHPDYVSSDLANSKWIGVLIGTEVTEDLRDAVEQGTTIIDDVPLCAIALKRYRSDTGQVFIIADTYVPPVTKRVMDRSTYLFDGQTYNKRKLALAIVRKYVETRQPDFGNLESVFPKKLQGTTFGVFWPFSDAEDKARASGHKRHFIESPLTLSDGKMIAVCSQWGKGNIGNLISVAKDKLGYDIKPNPA